jgi:hypothetical protein
MARETDLEVLVYSCCGVMGMLWICLTVWRLEVEENVEQEGKRGRKGTDLFKLLFFVAFLYRTEHPFRHCLIADAEFDGSIQDRSAEN